MNKRLNDEKKTQIVENLKTIENNTRKNNKNLRQSSKKENNVNFIENKVDIISEKVILKHKELKSKINILTSNVRKIENGTIGNSEKNANEKKINHYVENVTNMIGKFNERIDKLIDVVKKTRITCKNEIKILNSQISNNKGGVYEKGNFNLNNRDSNQKSFNYKMKIKLLDNISQEILSSKQYVEFLDKNLNKTRNMDFDKNKSNKEI